MNNANPLLLTLTIDDKAQQYFNTLRIKHFPADRNFLDAHLMLFHQLPADENKIITDIENTVTAFRNITLNVTALAGIGRGVAFKTESPELAALHKQLQTQWERWLIPQDKQRLWPHITIQNKVAPDEAKALLQALSAAFEPFEITGTGLSLWEYQGGPWKFISAWDFCE